MIVKYLYVIILFIIFVNINSRVSYKYIIVTGASSNHELSIIQFVYYCLLNNKYIYILIWNLGFTKKFLKVLNSITYKNSNIEILYLNFSLYPSYFNIKRNKGEYAWKPLIISLSYYKMRRTILWLDAGCVVLKSLENVFYDIEKYNCWSIYSCGNISAWTHYGMIEYFNITTEITKRKTCAGGLVGFKWNSHLSVKVLKEWVSCAYHKDCISPKGSDRRNHRQDQSALSILLYKYNVFDACPNNIYNIRTNCDLYNHTRAKELINYLT